jgi:hypothetical protein
VSATSRICIFALLYVVLSLAIAAGLIVFGGLKVPQDNARIAPVILTIPPILAALISGYRKPKALLTIVVLTAVITVAVTHAFIKITGISIGLIEPMINRLVAGVLAGFATNRLIRGMT